MSGKRHGEQVILPQSGNTILEVTSNLSLVAWPERSPERNVVKSKGAAEGRNEAKRSVVEPDGPVATGPRPSTSARFAGLRSG